MKSLPVVIALVLAGCRADCVMTPAALAGSWTYQAQSDPVGLTVSGGLTVGDQGCAGFQGSLDGTQNYQGTDAPLSGVVFGQMVDNAHVQFTVTLGNGAVRYHLGAVSQDSIAGTWVEQSGGTPTVSGSFVAARGSAP